MNSSLPGTATRIEDVAVLVALNIGKLPMSTKSGRAAEIVMEETDARGVSASIKTVPTNSWARSINRNLTKARNDFNAKVQPSGKRGWFLCPKAKLTSLTDDLRWHAKEHARLCEEYGIARQIEFQWMIDNAAGSLTEDVEKYYQQYANWRERVFISWEVEPITTYNSWASLDLAREEIKQLAEASQRKVERMTEAASDNTKEIIIDAVNKLKEDIKEGKINDARFTGLKNAAELNEAVEWVNCTGDIIANSVAKKISDMAREMANAEDYSDEEVDAVIGDIEAELARL